jgi:hypothetical protein
MLLSISSFALSVSWGQLLLPDHCYSSCHLCNVIFRRCPHPLCRHTWWLIAWRRVKSLWHYSTVPHLLMAFNIAIDTFFWLYCDILLQPGFLFENLIKDHGTFKDRVVNSSTMHDLIFPEQVPSLIQRLIFILKLFIISNSCSHLALRWAEYLVTIIINLFRNDPF